MHLMDMRICEKCGSEMYVRKSKLSDNGTVVYICRENGHVIYVWPDGTTKEGDMDSTFKKK